MSSTKSKGKRKAPDPSVASGRSLRSAAATTHKDPNVIHEFKGTELIGYIIIDAGSENSDDSDSANNSENSDDSDSANNLVILKPLPNATVSTSGNQCFLNTALQAIVWLVHLGTFQFISDSWELITTHPWLHDEDGSTGGKTFIKLFEKLLIEVTADKHDKNAEITRHEVSHALYHLQQQTAGTPHKLDNLKDDTVISKTPSKQGFGDAGVVFFWLYDCLLVMSGTNITLLLQFL